MPVCQSIHVVAHVLTPVDIEVRLDRACVSAMVSIVPAAIDCHHSIQRCPIVNVTALVAAKGSQRNSSTAGCSPSPDG